MFFILFILKNFFINSNKHVFFFLFLKTKKTIFHNSIPKHNFFFLKHKKLFLKTVFMTILKNNNQTLEVFRTGYLVVFLTV